MNIRTISILIAVVFSTGCRKIIEPKDLPDQDPRIVLNCVLYTDSLPTAYLSVSKSIISGKDYKNLDNAVCDLYEDGNYVEKLVFQKNGRYTGIHKPLPGKKYTVTAGASGYKNVEGSSNMGNSVSIYRIERYDTINSNISLQYYQQMTSLGGMEKFRIYLKDDVSTRNYYALSMNVLLYDTAGNVITHTLSVSLSDNAGQVTGSPTFNSSRYSISTDETLVNGNELVFDVSVYFHTEADMFPPLGRMELTGSVSNVSEDYYKYLQSANRQAISVNSVFSEPVIVYNNISNGMGIVGCFNSSPHKLIRVNKLR